jgi:hypothetical protein
VKATDLRPCDVCAGELGLGFHLVRTCAVLRQLDPAAEQVIVTGDVLPAAMTELVLCFACFTKTDLPILVQRRAEDLLRAFEGRPVAPAPVTGS